MPISYSTSGGQGGSAPPPAPPVTDPAAPEAGRGRLERWLRQVRDALHVLAGTPRVLRLVWEAHPGFSIGLIGINALQGLVPVAQVWITKLVIDAVATAVRTVAASGGTLSAADVAAQAAPRVLGLIALQGLVTLATQALEPAARLMEQQLGDFLTRDVNVRILRKTNSLPDISFFESPQFYDALQRAQQEASWRPVSVLRELASLLRGLIALVSAFGLLVAFAPLLALAVVILALPQVIVQFQQQWQTWSVTTFTIPEVRLMNYLRGVLTGRDTAREVRLFGLGDYFLGQYLFLFEEFRRRYAHLRDRQWRENTGLAALSAVGSAGAYAYVVLQALAGRITLGGLTFYTGIVGQVRGGLAGLVYQMASLYQSNLFVNHVFEFLELQSPMAVRPPALAHPVSRPLREGITFDHVAFRYPGTERMVLEDVSFDIRPGQAVALVGENGAGKTTLVKLLARLYDPTAGRILIDGVDLLEYDLEAWRRQIGIIFQDFARYHIRAGQNIGVGLIERIDDLSAIETAASFGGADAVVARLANGYDTILGRQFFTMGSSARSIKVEEGVELSGGEWQKIALARAFMRTSTASPSSLHDNGTGTGNGVTTSAAASADGQTNGEPVSPMPPVSPVPPALPAGAQVLVLDEPTAALDAQSEYNVYTRFRELTQGRAALLISHRFSTVKMADHIVVVEHGRVTEQGSHQELVARSGRYAELYEMQAERYR